jgi:ADP-heptose:LPS heptosyltransferase
MISNVLLSRTDRIGDLILSTPAIATVRASFPQARIRMIVSPYNRVVMERNSDVDELIDLPSGTSPAQFGRQQGRFDVAIALAPRAIDLQLAGGTRAAVRVGYTYERRWVARLTAPLYVNRLMISEADPELCERDPHRVVRHEVEQLLDLVALGGARQRVNRLRLDLTDADRAVARTLPASPIVVHLGKRWLSNGSTLDGTLSVVATLARLGPVVVTCPEESDEVSPAFERLPGVVRVLRDLPFFQWAAVFEHAGVVVTVDTGATHVASATRRPTVVAFEHRYFRLNSQEWAPYGVPHVLVRKPIREDSESLVRFRDEIVRGVATLLR